MATCPSCLRSVPDEALSCPGCGAPMIASASPTKHQPAIEPAYPAASPALNAEVQVNRLTSPGVRSVGRFIAGAMLAGRYRIVSLLGKGGMGEVYKAEDLKLHQTVALKFLPEAIAFDAAALARFHNEVRIARQVAHPNVCHVYDIGEVEGLHFLSMEFIDGEDLGALLKKVGRLPGDKAVEIARQMCAGLAAAHEAGVLHRDLKPANVMIDGRGRARLTDFGLAVVSEELHVEEVRAGTPAYMAPEQVSGKEVTQRSDIYSLGLVLYELFTGKRAFDAKSVHELMELHEKSTPQTPSSHVKEIDPLAERVILRCLERDPDKRPASALAVAAALPGGDPLAAALAMGETPSPEMVAASPQQGTLRPPVAAAYLVSLLAGLALIVLLSGKVMLHRQVPLDKSPEILRERAGEMIHKLGYGDPPIDSTQGVNYDVGYIRFVSENDQSATRWDRLKTGRPPVVRFWYRQSPRYLVPYSHWQVLGSDPPTEVPGMSGVVLDMQGRLINFYAVPPQVEEPQDTTPAPDWSTLFAEAGLDMKEFTPATPRRVPAHHNDARAAWEGVLSGEPQIPIRVEAAGYRSRPTYFEIVFPWDTPSWHEEYRKGLPGLDIILLALVLTLLVGGVMLARRNYSRGLGDRKGALRLALFMLAVSVFHWVLAAHHVSQIAGEFSNFLEGIAAAVFCMCLVWVFYIALEPFVRRRWPGRIISWSRLLAGEFRDPLVGRDVLIGGLIGTGLTLTLYFWNLAPGWFGRPPTGPGNPPTDTLLGFWQFVHYFLAEALTINLVLGLGFMFLLTLLLIVLRRDWLTAGVGWVLLTAFVTPFGQYSAIDWPFTGLMAGLILFGLMRVGLLAAISMFLFFYWTSEMPMTSDFSAFYAGSTAITLLALAALAVYGYRTALAGQPLLRGRLIED